MLLRSIPYKCKRLFLISYTWILYMVQHFNLGSTFGMYEQEEHPMYVSFPRDHWNCIRKRENQKQVGESIWACNVLLITLSLLGNGPQLKDTTQDYCPWNDLDDRQKAGTAGLIISPHLVKWSTGWVMWAFSDHSKLSTFCQFSKS